MSSLIPSKICCCCCWYYILTPTWEVPHRGPPWQFPWLLAADCADFVWFLAPWLCTWYTWGEDASGLQPFGLCGRSISDTRPRDEHWTWCRAEMGYYCRPGGCRAGSACTLCLSRTPHTPPPDHGPPPGPDHRFYKGDCPGRKVNLYKYH